MQRLMSHLIAIGVTLLVILGLPRLPAVIGLGLPSWFSSVWLVLAILVLLAHLQRAKIIGLGRHKEPGEQEKLRDRAES